MKVLILSVFMLLVAIHSATAQGLRSAGFLNRAAPASTRKMETKAELLEPALTLEEAVALAKEDNPRGYYQLAINIGKSIVCGPIARRKKGFDPGAYSSYFLKKACDAGYTNAIFASVLIEDYRMEDKLRFRYRYGFNKQEGAYLNRCPDLLIEKYTGISKHLCPEVEWRCCHRTLSSSNDVASIRQRYMALVDMGVYQATNAIANLDFRAKESFDFERQQERADKAVEASVEQIKSVIVLPPEQTVGAFIDVSSSDSTARWSTNDNCRLHLSIGDSSRGLHRVLEFSEDGRLISVLPVRKYTHR